MALKKRDTTATLKSGLADAPPNITPKTMRVTREEKGAYIVGPEIKTDRKNSSCIKTGSHELKWSPSSDVIRGKSLSRSTSKTPLCPKTKPVTRDIINDRKKKKSAIL